MFDGCVKVHFAWGGQNGMISQDHDSFAILPRFFLQLFKKENFFGGVEILIEATYRAEGARFAKHECTCRPFAKTAKAIPERHDETRHRITALQPDSASARDNIALADGIQHV